jgi:hypothetical protein
MKKKFKSRNKNHWRILGIGLISCCMLWPSSTLAAPSISKVEGTLSDGQTIIILGTGFGATGPDIRVFDDFEKGKNGNTIFTGAGSAQVGQWDSVATSPGGPKYSNAHVHSGCLSSMSNWADNGAAEGGRFIGLNSLANVTQVYLSWWLYLPSNKDVPGTSIKLPNWKLFWIYHNPWPESDIMVSYGDAKSTGGNWFYMGKLDDTNNPQRISAAEIYNPTFTKGQWSRWEIYLVGSTSNGVMQMWETNASHARYRLADLSGASIHTGEEWNIVHFPGYGRGDPNSQTYYDDIYVATGAGAMARVEIGNSSSYTNCTNLAVITPTAWSNNSITAIVRRGSFASGGTAYLFVIDSTGAASPGYPIAIGSGDVSPLPPIGLKVIPGS